MPRGNAIERTPSRPQAARRDKQDWDRKAWRQRLILDYLHPSAPTDFSADLCIVGAGAAGLAIARTFIGTPIRVCLAESGGLAGEERNQALAAGESVGSPAFDPGMSRMRVFGGSCNLWGGGCIPLDRHDLAPRDWVPHSGWPIGYADIEPYYRQALGFCGIEGHAFAPGSFATPPAQTPLPLAGSGLDNKVFVRTPLLFGESCRAELARAPNITVLLHANVLELLACPSGAQVREARIGSLDGRRGAVSARHYVLCCGGIENARLLLLSRSVVAQGLGNQRDLVGRFFMDHPSGKLGTVFARQVDRIARPYDRTRGKGATPAFHEIGLSEQVQRTQRLLNGRVHPFAVEAPLPRGIRALRSWRAARRPAMQDEGARLADRLCLAMHNGPVATTGAEMPPPARLALQLGLGVGDLATALGRRLAARPTVKSRHVELYGFFEQAPNPASRVRLGNEPDALGQPKICVDWQLTALDRQTYRATAQLSGARLAQACGGRFEIEPWLDDEQAPAQVRGTAHHLGTTRMADDPQHGVVDRHGRVHGIDNLHVAGSSVFPTGGWAFPTFTIVALSLRLAERLRTRALATHGDSLVA